MERLYIQDKKFEKEDFATNELAIADYENCIFTNCDFSKTNLSQRVFLECEFNSCNLSSVNLIKTGLKNVRFKDCKLLGMHFENCDPFLFEVDFDNCFLQLSSFYKLKLKKQDLKTQTFQKLILPKRTLQILYLTIVTLLERDLKERS